MLVLSHFKGHMMGGFGGALKNISIGIASAHGKAHIHGVGVPEELWTADHNSFLECMADAAKSVVEYLGRRNMAFINVANRLSVDCDCDAHPHEPEMADIASFASGPRGVGPGLCGRGICLLTPEKPRSSNAWNPATVSTRLKQLVRWA
ncbi:MAG: DUF362 domain-containing protein [Ruthenibacterium lactatiformans]